MINLKINKYLSRKIFLSTENKIPFKTVIYIRQEYKVRISIKKCLFYGFFYEFSVDVGFERGLI